MDNYHQKYILTGSIDPLLHVCFGGMAFSYLVALLEERRHLAHAKEFLIDWSFLFFDSGNKNFFLIFYLDSGLFPQFFYLDSGNNNFFLTKP
ncbi:hypothetical protein MKW94_002809 [Papaver nudicaule]|uniref:Uncharacterized protein n=1 Tax=Papaver nudicaule TaxID=74823 RepID=A0AA41SE92_PAPNU|nr:hypothetical protein [Papaver nudicaule]